MHSTNLKGGSTLAQVSQVAEAHDGSTMLYLASRNPLSQLVFDNLWTVVGERVQWLDDPEAIQPASWILVLVEGSDRGILRRWEELACAAGASLMPCHIDFGEAVIGPVVSAGRAGCLECWERRSLAAHPFSEGIAAIRQQDRASRASDPWLTPLTRNLVAEVFAAMTLGSLSQPLEPQHVCYHLNLMTLGGRRHRVLPDPTCPSCSTLADDDPELTRPVLAPRSKPKGFHYRRRDLDGMEPRLCELYLDEATGLIQSLANALLQGYVSTAVAEMRIERRSSPEQGYGRSDRFDRSRVAALLEALERYAGHRPRARKTVVHGTYAEHRERALDPVTLGLHSEREYELNAGKLVPYSPELEMDFVWAYSFAREGPILIPEQVAYYFLEHWEKKPRFIYEISNGCALGSCPEEAIFHGILEIVERDAFFLTWYRRQSPPRVDLSSIRSPDLRARIRRMEASGYDLICLDTTTEFSIPCVWSLLLNRRGVAPYALCAAGAHPDPEKAIDAALGELGVCLGWRTRQHPEERAPAYKMLEDPYQVRQMHDHALLYTLPEAGNRLDFLTSSSRTSHLEEMRERASDLTSCDLMADLQRLLDRFLSRGMDVVVVDQTPPEQRLSDLWTFKVVIPGMVPVTYGHQLRRLEGLPRLCNGRHRGAEPLSRAGTSTEEINPDPHPFP